MDLKLLTQMNKPKPNWHGWIPWVKLESEFTIVCCDCGLAHKFQFRVNKSGAVSWRAKRDKQATKINRT